MQNKKNSFFTFCFSCIPGAGEMYFGLYHQGISLMVMFFGAMGLLGWLRFMPLGFVLPVIWFYSFFHVHNLKKLSEEAFAEVEDKYFFSGNLEEGGREFYNRNKKIIGMVLVIFGICGIFNVAMDIVWMFLPEMRNHYYLLQGVRSIPAAFTCAAFIYLGIKLRKAEEAAVLLEDKDNI